MRPSIPLNRRFRLLLLTLLLAFGSGPAALAHAAPDGNARIATWLFAQQVGAQHTICVGDDVQLRVLVIKQVDVPGRGLVPYRLAGQTITAHTIGDAGTVSPGSARTVASANPPGAAYFSFHAERAGTASVIFNATVDPRVFLGLSIGGQALKTDLTLTVEDCKYRLTTLSTWRVPGEANLTFVARISIAGMVEDGGGHYSGTARVQWTASAGVVGDCSGTVPPDSQATATVQVVGRNDLVLNLLYDTANVPLVVDCKETGGTRDVTVTPDEVETNYPILGGRSTLGQILRGPEDQPGTIKIRLTRASGE